MKKLSKIKLHDAVVLENREMKMISGGSGVDTYCGGGVGTCSSPCRVNGRDGNCTVINGVCGCLLN